MSAMHPVARRVGSSLCLLLVLLVGGLGFTRCTPPNDGFYQLNPPDPAAANGDILRSRMAIFSLDLVDQTPLPGIRSWQVIYQSRDANGEQIAVSGTVLVPKAPWLVGKRPIIGWSVGTRGLGDDCAPSYTMTQGIDYEGPFIAAALAKGWAVAISDYEGLGTPGTHTYMVGPAQGHAALDVIRAAQRLPDAGLDADAPVGLMGYSQGGGAAGWATELAGSYAPELNIRGAALGGVPGDLARTAEFLDGSLAVAFALMAAVGLDTAYDDLDLASYLSPRGEELIARANDLCLVSVDGVTTLIDTLFTRIDDYTTSNPLDTPTWQARLAQQELGHVEPGMPVFMYHGVVDEIVPFDQAADLREDWCDAGATVDWQVLPGEHVLGMVEGAPLALSWMEARMWGWPTFGNCWLP